MPGDMPDSVNDPQEGAGAKARLRLSRYMPYRLSVASNKVSGLIARAYQSRFGLSIWEWRVIAVLGEGEALPAQAICEATAMDKVSVSRAIRSLDERALVTRTRRADDRRASDVALTEDGARIYAEVAPLALEYERTLLEDFTEEERETLMTLLLRLEASAGETGP